MAETKRVRIAVAISSDGSWWAEGVQLQPAGICTDNMAAETAQRGLTGRIGKVPSHVVFVEVDVPLPELPSVKATSVKRHKDVRPSK